MNFFYFFEIGFESGPGRPIVHYLLPSSLIWTLTIMKTLENKEKRPIPTDDTVKMLEFVLENKHLKFYGRVE